MIFPILSITGFQELSNQMQKTFVGDTFAQYPQERIVIDIIEISFNVSLYPPSSSVHLSFYRFKAGMTTPFRSKPVGVFPEACLEIRVSLAGVAYHWVWGCRHDGQGWVCTLKLSSLQ